MARKAVPIVNCRVIWLGKVIYIVRRAYKCGSRIPAYVHACNLSSRDLRFELLYHTRVLPHNTMKKKKPTAIEYYWLSK